jgi:hypothetical protein
MWGSLITLEAQNADAAERRSMMLCRREVAPTESQHSVMDDLITRHPSATPPTP